MDAAALIAEAVRTTAARVLDQDRYMAEILFGLAAEIDHLLKTEAEELEALGDPREDQ